MHLLDVFPFPVELKYEYTFILLIQERTQEVAAGQVSKCFHHLLERAFYYF